MVSSNATDFESHIIWFNAELNKADDLALSK